MDSTKLCQILSIGSFRISVVAEKFVDIAMDNGVEDEELKELIGHDDELDEAIRYNLDIEQDEEDYEDA